MKRMLTTVLLTTLMFASSAESRKQWDVGLRAGANIGGLYGTDADTIASGTRTGFTGGVTGTRWISPNVGIRLELLYTQRGATERVGFDKVTVGIDYVDVPLLVVFERELTPRVWYASMHAGPMVSIKTKAEYEGVDQDLDGITSDMDFSGVVGISLFYHVGQRIDAELTGRYTVGFQTIDDREDPLDFRNYGFAITLGVRKRLGYW